MEASGSDTAGAELVHVRPRRRNTVIQVLISRLEEPSPILKLLQQFQYRQVIIFLFRATGASHPQIA